MALTRDPQVVLTTKTRFSHVLLNLNKIHSVGVGYKRRRGIPTGELAIVVCVERKLPIRQVPPGQRIPRRVQAFDAGGDPLPGIEVEIDVQEGGPYVLANTGPVRPLVPGFSVGNLRTFPNLTTTGGTGTIGARLIDVTALGLRKADEKAIADAGSIAEGELPPTLQRFFLTCAHVFVFEPQPSDSVLQPGLADGGAEPSIGTPVRWTPLPQSRFEGEMPAGVKPPLDIRDVSFEDAAVVELAPTEDILTPIEGIGAPIGLRAIGPRDLAGPAVQVQKSGRTTGVTRGNVTAIWVDVAVGLSVFGIPLGGRFAMRYMNQIQAVSPGIVAPGDSGALVLDAARNAVGLCVAGATDGNTMFFTPIRRVLYALNNSAAQIESTGPPGRPRALYVLVTR